MSFPRRPVATTISIIGCALLLGPVSGASANSNGGTPATGRAHTNPRAGGRRRQGCPSLAARGRRLTGRCAKRLTANRVTSKRVTAKRVVVKSHRKTTPRAKPAPPAAATSVVPTPAAQIAAVLATPCQNTELFPTPANAPLVQAAVLCLINTERARNGETPLASNGLLERAAQEHSQELVTDDYFAHISPSGETPVDRIKDTGYIASEEVGYVIGENLAWGTMSLSTPEAVVSAWIASPGHLANILEAQYTDTGVAVVPAVPASLGNGAQGATYAQEFGVILP